MLLSETAHSGGVTLALHQSPFLASEASHIRASPSYTPGSSSASSSPNPTAPPCTSAQPRRSGSTATGRRERTYKQKKKNCGKSTGRRAGASAPKSRRNNCGKSSTGRTGRRALAHLKTETKGVEKNAWLGRAGASAPTDRNKTSAVRKRNTARRQDGAGAPTAPRVWRGWRRPR